MYQRDVPKIIDWVRQQGPDGIVAVGTFVLTTIRVPFSRVAPMVAEVKECGENATCLWGFKQEGYRHIVANREGWYQKFVEAPVGRSEALLEVSQCPGLGLVKAGFLLQCLGYKTACLDSHNVKRYDIDPKSFKVGVNLKIDKRQEKVNLYIDTCDNIGTSEYLWDEWCGYVSGNRYNRKLVTADSVSAYHYEAITA